MKKIIYRQNNNIFRIFTNDKIIVLRAVPKKEYEMRKKEAENSNIEQFKTVNVKYTNFVRSKGFDRYNFPIIECISIKKAAIGN
ncbi:hypothetical protein ES703_62772 [subsurface metagenome]